MRDEKKQQKEALKEEMLRLGNLQRECKEEKFPVYITFDGYDGAGKGVQIGRLMLLFLFCMFLTIFSGCFFSGFWYNNFCSRGMA